MLSFIHMIGSYFALGGLYPSTTTTTRCMHALVCHWIPHLTTHIMDLLCLVSLPFGASESPSKWPKNTNKLRERERERKDWIYKHSTPLNSTPHSFIWTCSVSMPFGAYDSPSKWATQTKGEMIQFTNIQHVAQCKVAYYYKNPSTTEPTHIDRVLNSWNFEFCLILELREGWGAQIAHKKSHRHNNVWGGVLGPVLGGYQEMGESQPGF